MYLLEAHQRSQDAFGAFLGGVGADHLGLPAPCPEWTVRDLVGHVVAGNARVAGSDPPAMADPRGLGEAFRASARMAQVSFAATGGLTRTVRTPLGAVPGEVPVAMRAADVLAHAWDLARAIGQGTDLDRELAEELLGVSRMRLGDDLRGPGRPFGPAQPCDQERPAADRLAAFLGRGVE